MDPGLSHLPPPRLTALSCQTNEHAGEQRERREREGMRGGRKKETGGGWL